MPMRSCSRMTAFWTAGAMISQLDLMMALIERFCGAALAQEARRRLAAPRRVSQAPYIAAGSLANGDRELAAFESFVSERLKSTIALGDAARVLHISTRTLSRRIHAATGLSPSRLIQKIRLGGALNLIEHTRLSLDRVAECVGLSDAAVLHRLVVRHTGQSPGRFRGGDYSFLSAVSRGTKTIAGASVARKTRTTARRKPS